MPGCFMDKIGKILLRRTQPVKNYDTFFHFFTCAEHTALLIHLLHTTDQNDGWKRALEKKGDQQTKHSRFFPRNTREYADIPSKFGECPIMSTMFTPCATLCVCTLFFVPDFVQTNNGARVIILATPPPPLEPSRT